MADEDLGIRFKDTPKDDDLGIKFKDDSSSKGSSILDVINQAGGTVGRAIGYGLSDIANLPIEAANYANQKVAGLFGVKPENVPTPDEIDPSKISMPFVSQQKQQELDPLARGLTTGAELATPAFDIAKLGSLGAKKLLENFQDKLGLAAKQKSKTFINELLQGKNISEATKPVSDEIRSNYSLAKKGSNQEYTDIKNDAIAAGYTPSVTKTFPGISVESGEKSVATNNLDNMLSKLNLEPHSTDIKDSIKSFTNNPSFERAHNLQSELGVEGAKLKTDKDGSIRKMGGELQGLRGALRQDIMQSFVKNGDSDLAKRYSDATETYKNTVAPYIENPTLRKISLKSGLQQVSPKTIGNLLKSDDASIQPIKENLSDESKSLLLATNLKSALSQLPKKGIFKTEVDPKNLINAYGQLDNKGLAFLRTPSSQMKIESIIRDLSRQNKLKWAAGLAIPALIGTEGLRRIL